MAQGSGDPVTGHSLRRSRGGVDRTPLCGDLGPPGMAAERPERHSAAERRNE